MADHSTIEWTDATWTPIRARTFELQNDGSGRERIGWHCEHVSEGCRHCYAERRNAWIGTGRPFKPAELKHRTRHGDRRGSVEVFLDEKMLGQPQRWRRPRDIFVCSMTDLFADFVSDEIIDQVFAVISESPWHRFQVLTKRAKRMRAYMTTPNRGARVSDAVERLHGRDIIRALDDPEPWPLRHVILMVSAETQREADERIPELLATPAARRGVSLEPLLGPIDLERSRPGPDLDQSGGQKICQPWLIQSGIDWVIVGGESGPGARPMHPDWARSLRDQCTAAGVPFMFKQWGEWWEVDSDSRDEDTGDHYVVDVPSIEAFERFDPKTDCLIARDGRVFTRLDGLPLDIPCRHMTRLGKRAAGRLLDGVEHNELPGHAPRPAATLCDG